jgi:hypothetical protein
MSGAGVRRVVTGKTADGKSVVLSDGDAPRHTVLEHTPGFVTTALWHESGSPVLNETADPTLSITTLMPGPGGATFMVITFPPDSVCAAPDFRPDLAGPEHAVASPGISDTFERDNPGMHTTPTKDYVVVEEGEIWLELDDGQTVHLRRGDTVVQQGARHAWRNRGTKPATIAVVLTGAES